MFHFTSFSFAGTIIGYALVLNIIMIKYWCVALLALAVTVQAGPFMHL